MQRLNLKNAIRAAVITLSLVFGLVLITTDRSTKTTVKPVANQTVPEVPPEVHEIIKNTKKITNIEVPLERTVVLFGEVADNSYAVANSIIAKAKESDGEPIYLLISSGGGSVLDGAAVINAIEASPVPVHTVCVTVCASMAAVIHQHGSKRYMMDRSLLMFHDAAGGLQGYLPHMKAQLAVIERYVLKFDAYIANRAGITLADFVVIQSKNLWIDSEDALKRKLNDDLVYITVTHRGSTVSLLELSKPSDKNTKKLNLRWE